MAKVAAENLFLMEFLVDHVTLDPCCDCVSPGGEKCVTFQFLDNAPLDVCEADFNPQRNYGSKCPRDTNVKSGKSCLFSMTGSQVEYCMEKFDIFVTVFKKMQPGWLPEKVEIGMAIVPIVKLFCELISSLKTTRAEGTVPAAKTMKSEYNIEKISGDRAGCMGVYVRMSCFGKLIVTQFQMNLQDKSVLFKDKEGKSLYRYKKAPNPCCPPRCTPCCPPCGPPCSSCCGPPSCCPPACPPPSCCPPACPPPSCCPPACPPPSCCPPACPPPSCCPPACPPPRCPPPRCPPPFLCPRPCPTSPCCPPSACCPPPSGCPPPSCCPAPSCCSPAPCCPSCGQ